jgi:hypothetical protein
MAVKRTSACSITASRYREQDDESLMQAVAPNNTAKRLACAAKYGQAHSIGAAFGGGTIANFLGGNSVSSVLNLGLALTGNQPLSGPPNLTGVGLGLPVNDVLRLTGGQTNPLYGSLSGTIRSTGIRAGVNAFLGTGDSIVSLGGEASLASFGGVATTAATAAEAASVIGIAKFLYDGASVVYGYNFACPK